MTNDKKEINYEFWTKRKTMVKTINKPSGTVTDLFVHWMEVVLQELGILFQALSYKCGQAKSFSLASLFCSLLPSNRRA